MTHPDHVHPDDQPVTGVDPAKLREWLTAGAGASLTADQLAAPDMPADVLPEPGTPVSVMRNVRMPWDVDVVVKAAADAAGVSVSEWIRDAVLARLATEPGVPNPAIDLYMIVAAANRVREHLPHRDAA